MLRWRLLLGVVFVGLLALVCWLDFHSLRPGIYLLPLACVVSLLAAGELVAMYKRRPSDEQPLPWVVFAGVLLVVLASGSRVFLPQETALSRTLGDLGWLSFALIAGLLLACVGEVFRFDAPGKATIRLAFAAFAIVYLGALMGFMVQLRLFADNRQGMLALLSLIATVKMSDIGQYTVGRLIGRRKLAPRVSPGKTWEGVIGGGAFAIVGAWLALSYGAAAMAIDPSVHLETSISERWATTVGFATAVTAAGIVGDLTESLLKRDVGVKDSSTWLPGFGGTLDLLDSLLGAAPVAYLFWVLGWVGR